MFRRLIIRWLAPVVSQLIDSAIKSPEYIKFLKRAVQDAEELRQLNENEAYMASLKKVPK